MHGVSEVNLSPSIEGADLSACTICGTPFRPPRGEECYGKCEDCFNAHIHNFARQHVPVLFSHFVPDVLSSPLHDAQPPGVVTETGGPPGDPPEQDDIPDGGAASTNSNMNSLFLSFDPCIPCRRCGVTFRPTRGVECDSLCTDCSSSSPPKRLRLCTESHRKAGLPS